VVTKDLAYQMSPNWPSRAETDVTAINSFFGFAAVNIKQEAKLSIG